MSESIPYSQLAFNSYLVPSGAFNDIVIGTACLVDGLYMTVNPIAPATYAFIDGLSAGGTVRFNGGSAPIFGSAMRLRFGTGCFLQQSGAGTLPQWVIIAAQLPSPDILVLYNQ